MIKPHLVFTKNENFFNVSIKNLENLNVDQIKELQNFVSNRNGIFDFQKYSFFIPKRLSFENFVLLLKHLDIKADCEENVIPVYDKPRIGFGQYKGMLYKDLSSSYLLWLKTSYRGVDKDIIAQEIKKRNI